MRGKLAHSEPSFLKRLLALAPQSQGHICLDPFLRREASGPMSHFSICCGLGNLPVPKAREGSGQSPPGATPKAPGPWVLVPLALGIYAPRCSHHQAGLQPPHLS